MKKETDKSDTSPFEGSLESAKRFIKRLVDPFNRIFNGLSLKAKRASVIFFGIAMASICAMLIIKAIYGQAPGSLSIDKITLPNDIYMNEQDTQKLTPLGKLKGEINGEFEAFYLAVDGEGQLYINRNPEYSTDAYKRSNGWQPITRRQLEAYEKELHFIPNQKKGLKR